MKLYTAIPIIFLIRCQVNTQFVYPDNLYLEQISTAPRPSQTIHHNAGNIENNPYGRTSEHGEDMEQLVATGVSKLAISINNYYLHSRTLDNIVFSPVSIVGALALVLLGSNGKTFDEIASAMGLAAGTDVSSNSQVVHESLGRLFSKLDRSSQLTQQIKIAAAIFVQNNFPIRNLYKQTSKHIYKNEIVNLDFRRNNVNAQRVINEWVSDRTNGKIKSILSDAPSPDTKVIIASALYFNGAWEKQFWDGFTKRRLFYPNGRKSHSSLEIDMMSNGGQFPYYRDNKLDCDIIGFPYKGNATTMYVILPQDSTVDKLKSFEASLTSDDIIRLIKSTDYTTSVVLFPKMRLEATNDLREPLQNLGIRSLFNPYEANLALLSPGSDSRHPNSAKEVFQNVNPIAPPTTETSRGDLNNILIFSRYGGGPLNCTQIFNPNSNMSECAEIDRNTQRQVNYKKFGDKLGRRVTREATDTLDQLRHLLNSDPNKKDVENPGLYADQVIHKVYIDITEHGTEAAASTSISLNRGGDIAIVKADIPFLFFIWHEETNLILFWGTVYEPTPTHN